MCAKHDLLPFSGSQHLSSWTACASNCSSASDSGVSSTSTTSHLTAQIILERASQGAAKLRRIR